MRARTDLGAALDSMLNRVAVVAEQAGDRFPVFADPGSGQWTTSRRGTWTGGFWTGLWWLRAAALERDEQVARVWTERLTPRAGDDRRAGAAGARTARSHRPAGRVRGTARGG